MVMERAGIGGLPIINHLLQQTLRSLCGESHDWVYSVFWRILPRNYPPPKWENNAGPLDRNKGNKRNWILVWEDGYCDFVACSNVAKLESHDQKAASTGATKLESGVSDASIAAATISSAANVATTTTCLQPELFFKMSHDVYNYGEGLMGKVAADNSHKWIFRDPSEQEMSFLSPWQGSMDTYPRTWEAQFKAGIQTIAIIAVGEGLLQLGSIKKVPQDVDFVLTLQRKFNYLQSIPGVFAPHPTTTPTTMTMTGLPAMATSNNSLTISGDMDIKCGNAAMTWPVIAPPSIPIQPDIPIGKRPRLISTCPIDPQKEFEEKWSESFYHNINNNTMPSPSPSQPQLLRSLSTPTHHHHHHFPLRPSMSSLQALLSKLPAVSSPVSKPLSTFTSTSPTATPLWLPQPIAATAVTSSSHRPDVALADDFTNNTIYGQIIS